MNYKKEIIAFCKENRVSTTEVADALGKNGVMPKILPINNNQYKVGQIKTVFTANMSNYAVHEQVIDVKKGDVVIIFTHGCEDRAIIGDLIAKFVLLYKRASAIVVQGLVRDVAGLRKDRFAVWSEGVSPLGCFNVVSEPFPPEKEQELRELYEGGVAVCDDGGVTVIAPNLLNAEILNRLHRIEMQEDIWFYCLDTLKWDTKKIVCDKAYLTEQDLLSKVHIEQLEDLNKPLDTK